MGRLLFSSEAFPAPTRDCRAFVVMEIAGSAGRTSVRIGFERGAKRAVNKVCK
ncbi:hypothetical protein CLOSTMETH_00231 [[Clostridium] methylpentosum DSM 5476]|uniref:Uncharacterized protein n=1 Tax=[Clostridium] methylpentosum DSM 5476 TaxID=537013 RepID=C0E8T6_9FIRM|nr:hypothetical protein CLOSTMETH_00231 [[Clostridium] methylpentosum DSM 5476]